jgi:prepilin-type N-terminal cleavage/methylation domain-containing protein
MKDKTKNKGLSLVEVVISASLLSIVALAAVNCYSIYLSYVLANQSNVQAAFLLEEEMEAVIFLRDKGYGENISSLPLDTPIYLMWNGSLWATSTTPEYVDGQFLRSFVVSGVLRDSDGRISGSGSDDPDTRKITASVSYLSGHATTTKSISTIITDLYAH